MMSLEYSGGMLDGFVGEIKCLSVAHPSVAHPLECSFSFNLSVCYCFDLRINDNVLLR